MLTIQKGENNSTAPKAAQLQAFLETARRLTLPPPTKRYQIISPKDAARLVTPNMAFLDHEEMRVLVLDTKNQVVANVLLYKGTVNSSVVRVSEIFHLAVIRKCPGIIICHNHPSGSTEPSQEDIDMTKLCLEPIPIGSVRMECFKTCAQKTPVPAKIRR
jgi:DNA repair protein RadC